MDDEPRIEHDPEASVSGAGVGRLRRPTPVEAEPAEPTRDAGTLRRSEPTNGEDPDLATLVGLEAELADLDADLAQVDRSDRAPREAEASVDGGGSADG